MEQVIFTKSYSQILNLLTSCVSGMTGLRHFYVQCKNIFGGGGVLSKHGSKVKCRYSDVEIYVQVGLIEICNKKGPMKRYGV